MGLVAFAGYALLGLGPAAALFALCVSQRSLLVLTTLASTFYWLVALVLAAAPWVLSDPVPSGPWGAAGMVAVGVAVQEGARVVLYRVTKRGLEELQVLARKLEAPPITTNDQLQVWFSLGLGHGISHSLFAYLSVATLTLGPGTLYVKECPDMSYFLAAGLTSMAFVIMHTFLMLVSFHGFDTGSRVWVWIPPVTHMAAALLTTLNAQEGACMFTIPVLHVVSLACVGGGAVAFLSRMQMGLPVDEGDEEGLGGGQGEGDGGGLGSVSGAAAGLQARPTSRVAPRLT